tara:strand:- start:299 stop:496 length:198 start_codon:yes stop_codon:yes gene_type:complete
MVENLSLLNMTKTYHIYLREECLFKDLDEYEFKIIWGRIYESYFRDELTYEQFEHNNEVVQDASY